MTASQIECRVLGTGDVPALRAFLEPRIASSMFLLGNLHRGGIEDCGERDQGTYVGAFDGGALRGVVAHYHMGNVVLQAPHEHVGLLLEQVLRASGREVHGLVGPMEQVDAAEVWLRHRGMAIHARFDERDGLYELPLSNLKVPDGLRRKNVQGRRGGPADRDLLMQWHVSYGVELLHEPDDEQARAACRDHIERAVAKRRIWIAEQDGVPVACSGFNARLPEAVQIGGVWTPPELRGRGYARCAVAASLLDARAEGVERAILFTGDDNVPAIRSYAALGFERVGDYRLLLFKEPVSLAADGSGTTQEAPPKGGGS